MAQQQRYNGSFNERLLDSINDLGDRNIHDLWYYTIADYSNRLLTRAEDTLPAIAGLAKIVSDCTLVEYVAGLWSENLLRSIAWRTYKYSSRDKDHLRHENYVAPSWSWASLSGPVRYSKVNASFEDTTINAAGKHRTWRKGMSVLLEYRDELASADPFGRVKSGHLRLMTPILKAVLGYDASYNDIGQVVRFVILLEVVLSEQCILMSFLSLGQRRWCTAFICSFRAVPVVGIGVGLVGWGWCLRRWKD